MHLTMASFSGVSFSPRRQSLQKVIVEFLNDLILTAEYVVKITSRPWLN